VGLTPGAALLLSFSAGAERNHQDEQPPYRNPKLPVDQRVADLLSRMTLEEKIGQTESLWITNNLKSFIDGKGNFSPDSKVQEILKNGIGQLGGPSQGSSESEKATAPYYGKGPRAMAIFTNTIQKYVIEHNRLGIPTTFHEEALHGLVSPGATSFPQAIALAGTWDVDLASAIPTSNPLSGAHEA
jgi:beta-glucosidase